MSDLDRAVASIASDDSPGLVGGWTGGPSARAPEVFARLARYLTAPRSAAEPSSPGARAALAAGRHKARAQRCNQATSKTSTLIQQGHPK